MKLKKLVLTGAAGSLGMQLRAPLAAMCEDFVSTDQVDDIGELNPNETYVKADVADFDAVHAMLEGADMVIHFGAISDERPFETLLGPNFIGSYNIWEAGYQQGVRRIVYASSIHAVGMHLKRDFIGTDVAHRPDTFYGLSKCFTEDLGSLYWDKRQMESVHLRILSASGPVGNARAVGSWLSYGDLIQLVTRSIETPSVGFTVVYGVSNNDRVPVDNARASFLGYRPVDNAEEFAAEMFAKADPVDVNDPGEMCQGGPFAVVDLGESGVEMIKRLSKKPS